MHICELKNPCLNDAKCSRIERVEQNATLDYVCECPSGFSGANCEIGIYISNKTTYNIRIRIKKLLYLFQL